MLSFTWPLEFSKETSLLVLFHFVFNHSAEVIADGQSQWEAESDVLVSLTLDGQPWGKLLPREPQACNTHLGHICVLEKSHTLFHFMDFGACSHIIKIIDIKSFHFTGVYCIGTTISAGIFVSLYPFQKRFQKRLVLAVAMRSWERTSSLSSLLYACRSRIASNYWFYLFLTTPQSALEGLSDSYWVTWIISGWIREGPNILCPRHGGRRHGTQNFGPQISHPLK